MTKVYRKLCKDQKTISMVQCMVSDCMIHLLNALALPNECVQQALDVTVVQMNDKACAGRNVIKIGVLPWQWEHRDHEYHEYKSFVNDPIIGKTKLNCFEDILFVIVAHEVSHHVQRKWIDVRDGFRSKPHGDVFKNIYRELRKNIINPMIAQNSNPYKGMAEGRKETNIITKKETRKRIKYTYEYKIVDPKGLYNVIIAHDDLYYMESYFNDIIKQSELKENLPYFIAYRYVEGRSFIEESELNYNKTLWTNFNPPKKARLIMERLENNNT